MVFSADYRTVIKLIKFNYSQRQEKGYGATKSSRNFQARQIWEKLQERAYRSRIHVNEQLLRLILEWEHFHQVFVDEMIRQWRTRLRTCIRAHRGHFEHRLSLCLILVQAYTLTVILYLCDCYNSGHFCFGGPH